MGRLRPVRHATRQSAAARLLPPGGWRARVQAVTPLSGERVMLSLNIGLATVRRTWLKGPPPWRGDEPK